jgi:8-oxo-dGTP diphosphatase
MKLQVGVKALLQDDEDRYLFVRRQKAMANEVEPHWDIPGGRIEPDEDLDAALIREIAEETGLHCSGEKVLLSAQDIFVPSKNLHVVRLTYRAKATGTIRISHEHSEAIWMTLSQAKKSNIDPYIRKVITTL